MQQVALFKIAMKLSDITCLLLSKKDTAVRRKELLDVVSPVLLDHLLNNAHTMVTDKATSVTISDILAAAGGDLRPAMTAVAQLANQELVPGGTNDQVGCLCVCLTGVTSFSAVPF